MSGNSKVAHLRAKHDQEELQRINRLTGLAFEAVPVSLLAMQEEDRNLAESLLGEALSLWKDDSQQAGGYSCHS